MRRLLDAARGVAALLALAALLIGVPVALAVAVGWPLPRALPSVGDVGEALTRRGIDDVVVVKTLATLLWLAWAQVAVAFVVELGGIVRGRAPGRAPTLAGAQVLVARLLAGVALITSALAAPRQAPLGHPGLIVAAVALDRPAFVSIVRPPAEAVPAPLPSTSSGTNATYTVQRRDSLWSIAERTLGDGFRWQEIRDLNIGRTMTDGAVLTATTETIQPGWVLELPPDAGAPTSASSAMPAPQGEVVVAQPGDHLWSIAEDTLAAEIGREPTDGEVRPHWQRIVDANRAELSEPGNPHLIYSGQSVVIPRETPSPAAEPPPPLLAEPPSAVPDPPPQEPEGSLAPPATATTPAQASPDDGQREDASTEWQRGVAARAFGVAGATIAVGVSAALLRLRRRRLLRVPRGNAPPAPPSELDDVRTELIIAADEDHVGGVDSALHEIASELARRGSPARPRLLQVGPRTIEVLLTATTLPAPEGWRAEAGGTVWVRQMAATSCHSEDPAVGPLVAIGARDETGQLYLDLEAEAIVSITGAQEAVENLARSMVLELTHSPITERVDLFVVGAGIAAATDPSGDAAVRVAGTWDDIADELLVRAEQSRAVLAANRWPNAFAARARSRHRDELTPVVAVIADVPMDGRFERLCSLVGTGTTTMSIVVLGNIANATWIEVDGDLLRLPGLGVTCRAQTVALETAERVAEVLASAEHLPAQLPLLDDVALGIPLSDRQVDEEPAVLIRFLGEIDVVGGTRPLTPKQTAVIAYIALHAPAAAERIEDAVWTAPTASRRKRMANTISDCRFSLGAEHVPLAVDGKYSLGTAVGTDLELFDRHVAYAADRPPHEAVAILRRAVDLIRGPVFTYRSLDRESYVWIDLENWMTTWELKVVDTVVRLSELALELDDVDTAVRAAQIGLLALPTHPALTEALMRAYGAQGDDDAADRVYDRHVAALEQLGIDDVAETTIDLRDRIRRSPKRNAST